MADNIHWKTNKYLKGIYLACVLLLIRTISQYNNIALFLALEFLFSYFYAILFIIYFIIYLNSCLSILILFFFITKTLLFKTLLFFIASYFSLDILTLLFHYFAKFCKVNWLSKQSIKNLTIDLNLNKIHIKFFLYLQYFFFKE